MTALHRRTVLHFGLRRARLCCWPGYVADRVPLVPGMPWSSTLGGAACLGRDNIGSLTPGKAADLAVWSLRGVPFAGALSDPIEAWLRCGPVAARDTVVAGKAVVRDGCLTVSDVEEYLARHRRIASDWLAAASS